MTSVRKAYQRAIIIPTHHLDQLWKDYGNFESSVSRALAKGLLSEYRPKYNSARAVYREQKKDIDEIDWNMLAVPSTGSCKEEQQYIAWKKFLAFEKDNSQRIDTASSNKRIAFAFEQFVLYSFHQESERFVWVLEETAGDSALEKESAVGDADSEPNSTIRTGSRETPQTSPMTTRHLASLGLRPSVCLKLEFSTSQALTVNQMHQLQTGLKLHHTVGLSLSFLSLRPRLTLGKMG